MDPTALENLMFSVMVDATGYFPTMQAVEKQAIETAKSVNSSMGEIPKSVNHLEDLDKELNQKEIDFKKVAQATIQTGHALKSFGQNLSLWVTAPLTAMGVFSLRAFQEEEDAIFGMEAALRANGEEVQRTSQRHRDYAAQMQAVTTVADDVTIDLLRQAESFQLSEEQARRAVRNAIALQAAYGAPLQMGIRATAALELGHAEALQRVIKTLRGVKDPAEKAALAQQLLARGFEQAEARAMTSSGGLAQMANDVSDLQEQFGSIIAEAIAPFVSWLKDTAKWLQDLSPATKKWIVYIAATTAVIGPLIAIVGTLIVVLGNLVVVLGAVGGALVAIDIAALPVIAAVLAIVAVVGLAVGAWAMFTESGQGAVVMMKSMIQTILPMMIEGMAVMADGMIQQLIPAIEKLKKELETPLVDPKQWDESKQKVSELDMAVAKFAQDMLTQSLTIGMTTRQVQIYKLELEGATSAQIQWLKALDEDLKKREAVQKAMEDWNTLVKKGKELNERYLTPLQKFRKLHAELSDMLNKGVITVQTYRKALEEAAKDITVKVDFRTTGLDAVRAGTAEAMDMVMQFRDMQRQPRPVAVPAPLRPITTGPSVGGGLMPRDDLAKQLIAIMAQIEKNTKKDPHSQSVELELEGANF